MKRIGLIIGLFAANILWAADLDQGLTMISEKLDRFNVLLSNQDLPPESKREKLSEAVEGSVDFEAIARKTLGPYASKLTEEQTVRFHKAFKIIIKNWLVDDLMLFNDETIKLLEYAWLPSEKKVLVKTLGRERAGLAVTNRHRERTRTDYILQDKDGKWMIVDLSIAQVNIAMNYRSQIDAMAKRGESAEKVLSMFEDLAMPK